MSHTTIIRPVETVSKCFYSVKILLEIEIVQNLKYWIIQKCFSAFLRMGLIAIIMSMLWSFHKSNEISMKIEICLKLFLVTIYVLLFLLICLNYNLVNKILDWIEDLHRIYGHIGCFKKCRKISTKISVGLIWILPVLACSTVIFDCIIM